MNLKKLLFVPRFLALAAFAYTRVLGLNRIRKRGVGNLISCGECFMRYTSIRITGSGNRLIFGSRCRIRTCSFRINGSGNTILLRGHVTMEGCSFRVEDDGNVIDIGEDTAINHDTQLACIEGTSLVIGSSCLVSSGVTFRTGDSHAIISLDGRRLNASKDIDVGDHVWIGNKVMLLKGAAVARDSVVAAGAIVTKKISEGNVVLGGIPASIIKREINWNVDRSTAQQE